MTVCAIISPFTWVNGFDFTQCSFVPSVKEAQTLFDSGLQPKTVIAHKDVQTDGQNINDLVRIIRASREGEHIRLFFASQEFFREQICQTALKLGADVGWDPTGWDGLLPNWVMAMIRLGYMHPQEPPLRHREIVLSRKTANKRLELLNRPIVREREW